MVAYKGDCPLGGDPTKAFERWLMRLMEWSLEERQDKANPAPAAAAATAAEAPAASAALAAEWSDAQVDVLIKEFIRPECTHLTLSSLIDGTTKLMDIQLNEQQQRARHFHAAMLRCYGPAGSGKTLAAIDRLDVLTQSNNDNKSQRKAGKGKQAAAAAGPITRVLFICSQPLIQSKFGTYFSRPGVRFVPSWQLALSDFEGVTHVIVDEGQELVNGKQWLILKQGWEQIMAEFEQKQQARLLAASDAAAASSSASSSSSVPSPPADAVEPTLRFFYDDNQLQFFKDKKSLSALNVWLCTFESYPFMEIVRNTGHICELVYPGFFRSGSVRPQHSRHMGSTVGWSSLQDPAAARSAWVENHLEQWMEQQAATNANAKRRALEPNGPSGGAAGPRRSSRSGVSGDDRRAKFEQLKGEYNENHLESDWIKTLVSHLESVLQPLLEGHAIKPGQIAILALDEEARQEIQAAANITPCLAAIDCDTAASAYLTDSIVIDRLDKFKGLDRAIVLCYLFQAMHNVGPSMYIALTRPVGLLHILADQVTIDNIKGRPKEFFQGGD